MKKRLCGICFWLYGAALLILLSGCATQSVVQRDEDGLLTEYHSMAFFNKTAMTGTVLGKTTRGGTKQLFGQAGSSAETQTESITAFFEGLQGLFQTGFEAGKKSVVPVP